jgi:hypothetical protein
MISDINPYTPAVFVDFIGIDTEANQMVEDGAKNSKHVGLFRIGETNQIRCYL